MAVIEATGVYKVFGRRPARGVTWLREGATRDDLRAAGLTPAVIDASFEVAEGEIFVVMGLSGSGKSTLIRMVNGLLEPSAGTIKVDGQDVTRLGHKQMRAVRREKISMVFQHFALLPHRSVGDNASYGLEVQGFGKEQRRRKAEEALRMVGLDGWADALPGQLSGGMRQRVGLARALAAETPVLLMDEAFSALDPLIRREMQDQLVELQNRLGKTILFITHDLNEAMRLGDRIAMMRDGRIVQQGTAEQILNDPATDYVAQFVQDVDRTRVLTASSVMEKPVAVLGGEQGPRAAHRLMRENQLTSLFVAGRDRTLLGVLQEPAVAQAVDAGRENLDGLLERPVAVAADTPLADLFRNSAQSSVPLAVVDDDKRLLGVIAQVTLLHALGGAELAADAGPEPVSAGTEVGR